MDLSRLKLTALDTNFNKIEIIVIGFAGIEPAYIYQLKYNVEIKYFIIVNRQVLKKSTSQERNLNSHS